MARLRGMERGGPWVLSSSFLDSEEFAVAAVSAIAIVGFSGPLLAICVEHLVAGNLELGCSFGLVGLVVAGVGGWKLSSSVARARARFAGSGRGEPIDE